MEKPQAFWELHATQPNRKRSASVQHAPTNCERSDNSPQAWLTISITRLLRFWGVLSFCAGRSRTTHYYETSESFKPLLKMPPRPYVESKHSRASRRPKSLRSWTSAVF